ncbi:MAG: class I SAM-dependent methyltransferase [Phycisphaeraceae bacterium]
MRNEGARRLEVRPVSGRLRAMWKRVRSRLFPRKKRQSLINRYITEGNLLDVGCGTGAYFADLRSTIVPHGIEIDPDAVQLARQHAERRGGSLIEADALGGLSTVASSTMRGVVMHSFLEHEVSPLEVLQETRRVLNDEGVAIIKVPNVACWNRRFWHGKDWPGFRFPDHVNYFTPRTLRMIALKAGLQIHRFAWYDRFPLNDNMWLVAKRHQRVK